MFKQIPGNYSYIASLNGEIRRTDGGSHQLLVVDDKVEIELFGILRVFSLKWLGLFAFYEIDLPFNFRTRFDDVEFVDINPKIQNSLTGKVVSFRRPFLIEGAFRIIPGFSRYCIDIKGTVKEILTNTVVKCSYSGQYPTVYIYHPEHSKYKNATIHRLVALAWIKNTSFLDKPIVNHIDGNKNNFNVINLEWCNYSENMKHAVVSGLRTDNREYKVKDHFENKITIYHSFRQACLSIGLNKDHKFESTRYKRKPLLIKNRYEIKLLNDDTPWLHIKDLKQVKGMYTTEVVYKNGSKEIFYDTRDLAKKLKIWNVSCNINNIIEKAKSLYPDICFNVVKNYEVKTVQALNVKTKDIIECGSIREISRVLNINFAVIRNLVERNLNRIAHDYVFRYKTDKPWPTDFEKYISAREEILAINVLTSQVLEFRSQRSAAEYFSIQRCTLKKLIARDKQLNNWSFKMKSECRF